LNCKAEENFSLHTHLGGGVKVRKWDTMEHSSTSWWWSSGLSALSFENLAKQWGKLEWKVKGELPQ